MTIVMRRSAIVCAISLLLTASIEGQTSSSSSASRGPVELVGCVSPEPNSSGSFTLSDRNGGQYRLTGKSVKKYAGQMVRLIGGPQGRRLSIRGGLWPSPNVAAQAGAIDTAQESIARQPGGAASPGTGGFNLPEFRVNSVRSVAGSCR